MKRTLFPALAILTIVSIALYGCGGPKPTEPSEGTTPATEEGGEHGDMEHGDHEHDEHAHQDESAQSDMQKMETELTKLSAEDAASARKQHFCPVSGKMLGAMGAPKKVDVNGQQVWICCDGCRATLLAKPDEYLAKLNKE